MKGGRLCIWCGHHLHRCTAYFTMDVILNLREMDIEAEFDASGNPTPEFLSNIIQAIIQEYGTRASDSEAFIYPELTASNCVFGSKEPVRLLHRVSEWNGSIREQFLRCVDAVCKVSTYGQLPTTDQLPHPKSPEMYSMLGATSEMNDDWYDYADHAVFLEDANGDRTFRCILQPFDLSNIQRDPTEYAIVTVFPKS